MTIRPFMVLALLLFAHPALAEDKGLDLESILVSAKYAGFCGALKQLAAFQEATQMPGGDDLIERFMKTEAARLSTPLEQMMKNCVGAVKIYNEFLATVQEHRAKQ